VLARQNILKILMKVMQNLKKFGKKDIKYTLLAQWQLNGQETTSRAFGLEPLIYHTQGNQNKNATKIRKVKTMENGFNNLKT
jgi:hypothetical protein